MLTVGSLFSGVGGIELGLERTGGFKTIWQSEINPYASAVLKKHWPDVPNLGDITKIDWTKVERPDLICGGFPCQDISSAGKRAGIKEGTRSGLWFEYLNSIRSLRPGFALIENVSAIAVKGLDIVLAGLAESGYDAEWFTLQAAHVGAPHRRERLFILAHAIDFGHRDSVSEGDGKASGLEGIDRKEDGAARELGGASAVRESGLGHVAYTEGVGQRQEQRQVSCELLPEEGDTQEPEGCSGNVPDASGQGLPNWRRASVAKQEKNQKLERCDSLPRELQSYEISDANRGGLEGSKKEGRLCEYVKRNRGKFGEWWAVEPPVGRVAHGIPRRVDRIKCLGNAVVPQVAQVIGEAILEFDATYRT